MPTTPTTAARPTWRGRLAWCLRRLVRWTIRLFLGYAALVVLGLIPVNNGHRPAKEGVDIYIVSTEIHADIVMPVTTDDWDWRSKLPGGSFPSDVGEFTHVAVGWGDKGFYIGTPTWADLKLSTALHAAFWPSETCLHVEFTQASYVPPEARKVRISRADYERMAHSILASFRTDSQNLPIPIADAHYTHTDAFFEARGRYHLLNTCNCWTGRMLRAGGLRVGWFTPLPGTPTLYLGAE